MAKSGIHIKPSKRGTFTSAAKKRGKTVQGFASAVLANKENYSPAMVKKANFARNAAKWKKELGGYLDQELNNPIIEETPIDSGLVPQTTFGGGGSLTPDKAGTILSHGSVQGHPLTDKQRKFFGAIAGGETPQFQGGGDLSVSNRLSETYGTLSAGQETPFVREMATLGGSDLSTGVDPYGRNIVYPINPFDPGSSKRGAIEREDYLPFGDIKSARKFARQAPKVARKLRKFQGGGSLAEQYPDLKNLQYAGQYGPEHLWGNIGLAAGSFGAAIGGIRDTPGGQERIARRQADRGINRQVGADISAYEQGIGEPQLGSDLGGLNAEVAAQEPYRVEPIALPPRNAPQTPTGPVSGYNVPTGQLRRTTTGPLRQFGGILPTDAGYGVPMDFSDTQQEGYLPAYSDGGELLGYLPEHSFGSWLGDNAGKILKTAGGIVSVIPGVGQIAGPILIGAGAATDAIVGGVRKKRAEEDLAEAQGRQEAEGEQQEYVSSLKGKLAGQQPQIEYGATFGFQDGGTLGQAGGGIPQITEYPDGANSHQEGIGGIPVDAKGNPSTTSKQSAVGMTEAGEITWNGYVFSDKLKV